jgi:signal transduction histidine kinase
LSYKWLKWLILWIPTIAIGLWEYIRHALLLPFISMDLGNLLAPLFVFAITFTLLRALFARLEQLQESLQSERVAKAAFEERAQLARELHDGISQSLFMLSVKLDKLEKSRTAEDFGQVTEQIRQTVRHVYEDVRQSIAGLHTAEPPIDGSWLQSLHSLSEELERTCGVRTTIEWQVAEGKLSPRQKVELLAILREALMNVQKHANARNVTIKGQYAAVAAPDDSLFRCVVADDGGGVNERQLAEKGKYGVKMMKDRAEAMGWTLTVGSNRPHGTIIEVSGRRQGR